MSSQHRCGSHLRTSCSNLLLHRLHPLQFDKQLNLGLVRSAAARESGLDVEEFEARLQVRRFGGGEGACTEAD